MRAPNSTERTRARRDLQYSERGVRRLAAYVSCLMFPLLFLRCAPVFGQIDQAEISGTIRDTSGALVPGATIIAVSSRTGEQRSTTSNAQGFFSLPRLKPSVYTVQISLQNFADELLQNI